MLKPRLSAYSQWEEKRISLPEFNWSIPFNHLFMLPRSLKAWKRNHSELSLWRRVQFNPTHKQSTLQSALKKKERERGIGLCLSVLLFHLLCFCYITPAPFRARIMLHSRPGAVTSSTSAERWWLLTNATAPLAHLMIHKTFDCFLCSAHVTIMYRTRDPAGVWRRGFYFCLGQEVHSASPANLLTFNCPYQRDTKKLQKLVLLQTFKK